MQEIGIGAVLQKCVQSHKLSIRFSALLLFAVVMAIALSSYLTDDERATGVFAPVTLSQSERFGALDRVGNCK